MKSTPYNPQIEQMVKPLLQQADFAALQNYLDRLPHSGRRVAEALVAQVAGNELRGEDFFACFVALCQWNPKTFLGRMLGALTTAYALGRVHPTESPLFAEYAAGVVAAGATVDRNKCLHALLPCLRTPSEVHALLTLFAVDEPAARVRALLPFDTLPCAFVLFQSLRKLDHKSDFLVRTSSALVQRGDRHAFNLSSLINAYFDLPPTEGRHYALNVEPYRLGYAENDYAHFCRVLNSI